MKYICVKKRWGKKKEAGAKCPGNGMEACMCVTEKKKERRKERKRGRREGNWSIKKDKGEKKGECNLQRLARLKQPEELIH